MWSVSDHPICGNHIVEESEECDEGHHDDLCCFSAKHPAGVQCHLKPGKVCRYHTSSHIYNFNPFSPWVLFLLIWFYASVQVRACAANKTVDLSRQVRSVMRRQTVRETACVQVCPPTVLSRVPRRTSRCAVWGRGSAWTGYLSISHSVRYYTVKRSFTETRPKFNWL